MADMHFKTTEETQELRTCPFNKNHKLKPSIYAFHIVKKCPDRETAIDKYKLIQCPYSVTHFFQKQQESRHFLECSGAKSHLNSLLNPVDLNVSAVGGISAAQASGRQIHPLLVPNKEDHVNNPKKREDFKSSDEYSKYLEALQGYLEWHHGNSPSFALPGLQDTHVDQEFAKLSTLKMELTHVMEGGHEVSKELEKTVMGLTSNVLLQRMKPAQRRDYYKQMKELGRLQAHLLNCIPEASNFGITDRQPVLHDLEDPIDFHPNPENEWSRSECNYIVQSLDEYLTERAAALHPIDSSPDTSFLESNNLSEKSLLNTAFSLPCEPRSSGSSVSDISTQAVKGDDDKSLSAFSDADASQSKVINKLELVRPSRAAFDQVASTSKVHEVHKPSSSSVKKVDPSIVKPTSKIPVFNQCLKTRSLLLKESETLPPKVADAKDSKAALKSYKPSTASSSPMITITEHVDLDVSLQDCQTPEAQKRKTYKRPPSRSETEEMEREFTKRAKRRKVDIFGTPEGKTPPLPSPNEASGSREPVLTGRALMLKQPPQLVNPNSNLSIEQRKVLMQQRLKERQERLESLERMKANQKIAELELELMKVEAEERRRLAAVEKAQARKSTGQLSKDQSSMSVSPRVRRL